MSVIQINIDWADLDLFGHVNNVVIFRYVQTARVRFCEEIGLSSVDENKMSFMVASSQCQFLQPVRYPGKLQVVSETAWKKNTSFCIRHLLVNEKGIECARAEDVLVVYDHKKGTKLAITNELREALSAHEKK